MTSEKPTTPETPPLDQKRRVDQLCDRFEAAWKAGERPAIEAYLADVPEPLLLPVLRELVLLEAHYRRLRGERPHPEDYAARFGRLPAAWLEEALAPTTGTGSDTPTPHPAAAASPRLGPPAGAGTRLGGYELVEVLGRGGMGVVWKARQLRANRLVALKLILAGELAGEAEVRRFRAEAEIAAGLDHPNLVPLYEVGEDQGRHFFSMKLIEGGHLGEHLTHFRERPREAASLLLAVARAVQYAHQHGLLHRDLKPGNILLSRRASSLACPPSPPGQAGSLSYEPHVADFGLARRLDAPGLTQSGAVVGTPEYMAPEQARGEKSLTTATDVYGLGAILYATLTGRPPFVGESVLQTLEQVVGSEPVPPRQLNDKVPRDLETVCLKCLRKEPARRYDSAADLAEELRRFLAGEPVEARPVGRLEQGWRWCRRNPAVAALLALVATTLVVGATVAAWFGFWALGAARIAQKEKQDADTARALAETETKRADEAADTARQNEQRAVEQKQRVEIEKSEKERQLGRAEWLVYAGRLDKAQQEWREGKVGAALDLLHACRWDYRGWEYRHLQTRFAGAALTISAPGKGVGCVCFSPDGRWLAGGLSDRTVRVWEARTGKEVFSLKGPTHSVNCVCFSPDGKRLAGGAAPFPPVPGRGAGQVMVWDAVTGGELFSLPSRTGDVLCLCFSPDGRRLAGGFTDRTIRVWDARTGQELFTCQGHNDSVLDLCFSPDGRHLASAGGRWDNNLGAGEVRVWDAGSGRPVFSLRPSGWTAQAVCYSPDGARLLGAYRDGTLKVCSAHSGQELYSVKVPLHVVGPCFSPDGLHLAGSSDPNLVTVWEAGSGEPVAVLKGHARSPSGLCFSPDGKHLASSSFEGTVKVWDLLGTGEVRILAGHQHWVRGLSFSPDGRRLASGSPDRTVKIWDCVSGQELLTCRGHQTGVSSVCFSPDGKRVASGGDELGEPDRGGQVKIWDAATGAEVVALAGHSRGVTEVTFSPAGDRLASAGLDGTVKVWDPASGRQVLSLEGHADRASRVAFSPDGKQIASGLNQSVKLWDARDGRAVLELPKHPAWITGIAFSPAGERLAVAGGRVVNVWEVRTGREVLSLRLPSSSFESVCFDREGQRLATGDSDGVIHLWDAAGGQEVLSLKGHTWPVGCLRFGPAGDSPRSVGDCLASGGNDHTIKLWDADGSHETLPLKGHTGNVVAACFSPDGRRLASASRDETVKVWDMQTGQELVTLSGHGDSVTAVCFSADGRRLATGSADTTVKVWDLQPGPGPSPPPLTLPDTGRVWSLCFSPDGRRLATGSSDRLWKVWDLQTGKEILSRPGHGQPVLAVCFSPDGRHLATGSLDRSVKVWDASTGQQLFALGGMTGPVRTVRYSAEGDRVIAVGADQKVRCWDAATGRAVIPCPDPPGPPSPAVLSPDGLRLARPVADQVLIQPPAPGDEGPLPERLADPARENAWHLRRAWEARRSSDDHALAFHLRPLLLTSFGRWRQAHDTFPTWAWRPPVGRGAVGFPTGAVPVTLAQLRHVQDELTRQTESTPRAWEAWAARGWCRLLLGEPEEAVVDLKNAIGRHPDEPGLWALLGTVYLKEQRPDEAEAVRRRLADWPNLDVAVWHTCEARACAAEGAAAEEHWHLSRLLERPALPVTTVRRLVRRGVVGLELGQEADAAADFDRALALDPENTEALCWRVRVGAARGDLETARRLCTAVVRNFDAVREPQLYELTVRTVALVAGVKPGPQALAPPPGLPRLEPAWRGGLLLRAGDPGAAVRLLSASVSERQPGAPPIAELLLALAYGQQGKVEEGRRQLERARSVFDGEPALRTAAVASVGLSGPLPLLAAAAGAEQTRPRWDWATRLELRLLRREAETSLAH
jgi:WD40 repeat protein/serine/threonine protein kinase/tetratricopeptide (TPR) repeat protein